MEDSARILLATRIIFRAFFPVMKVMVADDPKMNKRFANIDASVQFTAGQGEDKTGAILKFANGKLEVVQGIDADSDMCFSFKTHEAFQGFMAGKPVIPGIKGFTRPVLLIKVVSLLLAMKLLMPEVNPTDPAKKRLKVKLTIYMITTALSQYNKGGDPDMAAWTKKQPDRIYQMSIKGEDIAAYIRVKAGKTKAGRGTYARRRPFVHMEFNGVDGALPIFLNQIAFVQAVGKQLVSIEGSPEYAANLNDFMQRIQALIV